jgi:hypothetical protein
MEMSSREFWTALHGMVFGAGFLLAFAGGWVSIWILRPQWITQLGAARTLALSKIILWTMTLFVWIAVLMGTWIVYPWYRAKPPTGSDVSLAQYPKYLLISKPQTSDWHEFGMEWKEHLAWLSPILMTAVAFAVTRRGPGIVNDPALRRTLLAIYSISFCAAAVAGLLGALINKAAPIH